MKTTILTFALATMTLLSCNSNKSFVTGSWTIDNLNSVDSSVNVETLLATSLVSHYRDKNILIFSSDNSVTMTTSDNKELDKGNFKLVDNDAYLTITFPSDKFESKYKITDKSDKTIKLSATDNGETADLTLTRLEK